MSNHYLTTMHLYPSHVIDSTGKGKCLIATMDLPNGTIVATFEGKEVKYADVLEKDICHAIYVGDYSTDDRWILPGSDAFFANHSCDPNCEIDDDLHIVTIRHVERGEELTYAYDLLEEGDEPSDFFWDPRWSFECRCGLASCRKNIHRYISKTENDGKR